eukprot:14915998-Heterocapsa_arctica.AAC.1
MQAQGCHNLAAGAQPQPSALDLASDVQASNCRGYFEPSQSLHSGVFRYSAAAFPASPGAGCSLSQ